MPIELNISPPATGKTESCIQRIKAVQIGQPLANVRVLVPDRLQAATFRRKLAIAGGGMGIHVGTFGDLYTSILEHSGKHVPLASSPLLQRIIQEIVDKAVAEGKITHFAPIQLMPGFILALRESFSELKRSLVTPDQFIESTRSAPLAQRELALLYSRYQDRMKELNLADPEGLSWLAVAALEQDPSAAASIRLLVVDGFDAFNGAQQKALKLLSGQVGELLVTFPGAEGSTRQAHRRFAQRIENLIREISPRITTLEHSPYLPFDLLYVEQQLFEAEKHAIQPSGQVEMLEARSPVDEAREALRWIKKLAIRNNLPLYNCVIFTPNPSEYHPALRACADEFGIPINFTIREPLSNSPAVTALLNLLTLPENNFNTRHLLNAIRSPYFDLGINPETADMLEMVSRVAQIVEGQDQWQETWERLDSSTEKGELYIEDERNAPKLLRGSEVAEYRNVMESVFTSLTPLVQVCSQTEWITWLEDLLERLQFYERANSERDLDACGAFRDTLRALVVSEAVAGERSVDYHQFLADLQATLEGVGVRETNTFGRDALLVANIGEARGLRFQAVALLGLSEGSFPVIERADPFLDEGLRATLGLDPRLEREQAGIFYQAVTRADQHLLLTRPYLSDDGEKREESAYWKAIQNLFEKSIVKTIRPDDHQLLVDAGSTQELLFSAVRRGELPKQYDFLLERLVQLRHAREVLRARRAKRANGPHEGVAVDIAPSMKLRFSPAHIWSASRMEYYSNCPFRFFIRTGLDLDQRILPEPGFDARSLGSMLHKILELTYKNAANPGDINKVLNSLKISAKEVYATAPRKFGFRPSALWEYEKVQILDRLEKTVRALAEDHSWTPIAYEAFFGGQNVQSFEIELENETIMIRGVIDRVDRNSKDELRVIDYKTGGTFPIKDLYEGQRLQLPIYALAAQNKLRLGKAVEGIYWNINGAEAGSLRLSKAKTESAEGVDAAYEIVCRHLQRIVDGIHAAEFSPEPPRAGCPDYCPAALWCWRYEPGW